MSDVLLSQHGVCGRITLNRPRAINALTLDMVRKIYAALCSWAKDSTIEFILVDGAGERGLCAGGDIRALYDYAKSGDFESAGAFFREEYRLNHLIARYSKPYLALMDGIVMGGGIGISAHGSHRIVTERSALAMPETSIGFIPDVGGTYLLGNAPEEFGTYLALTGGRIGAADAILCGLADTYVPSERIESLTAELVRCTSRSAVNVCLRTFAGAPPPGRLEGNRTWIDDCFGASSIEAILEALQRSPEEDAHATANEIAKNSPTSLKVTLLALRRGREFRELGPCLQQEYAIALACMRDGDFVEGVRAAVVDKDRKPAWKPDSLDDVTPERVASFFTDAGLPQMASSDWFS